MFALTLQNRRLKCNAVAPLSSNFYANWRRQNRPSLLVCEGATAEPPERLLQTIWHHQRLLREQLHCSDGRTIRILHPGFWNHESGPDFRGAVLKIGDEIKTGDVEIDLEPAGWRNHGHDRNPAFTKVILHVVWGEDKKPVENLPQLALKPFLDAPLDELGRQLSAESAPLWPEELSGQCCAPLRKLSSEKLTALLQQAALVRLERKAEDFRRRSRQVGWEQSLWEGLFRALGYKQNVWAMQRVAELLPQICAGQPSLAVLQSRLLGVSGLLPEELTRKEKSSDTYLRSIWDSWWRERDQFSEVILPRAIWRFNGLRPANHPQRRLALAAHWLSSKNFLADLEKWFLSSASFSESFPDFQKIFHVENDDFWSTHYTFRSREMTKPQMLIGAPRITDLGINVVLPWFWMRAVAGKNPELKAVAEQRYFDWPSAEDNSVLKLARLRLLGGKQHKLFKTAALQQGLLQIVQDFCAHSNAVCQNCRFPDLVRQLGN